jgi:hypothetical protein
MTGKVGVYLFSEESHHALIIFCLCESYRASHKEVRHKMKKKRRKDDEASVMSAIIGDYFFCLHLLSAYCVPGSALGSRI